MVRILASIPHIGVDSFIITCARPLAAADVQTFLRLQSGPQDAITVGRIWHKGGCFYSPASVQVEKPALRLRLPDPLYHSCATPRDRRATSLHVMKLSVHLSMSIGTLQRFQTLPWLCEQLHIWLCASANAKLSQKIREAWDKAIRSICRLRELLAGSRPSGPCCWPRIKAAVHP